MPRRSAAAVAAVLLAAATACSGSRVDPVQEMLGELEAAAEERDAERFAGRLSESFRAEGMDRTEALAMLRRYFAAYESVSVNVHGTDVVREGGAARVGLTAEFSGRGRKLGGLQDLLPGDAAYEFDLEAADEAGTWRVRAARWQSLDRPASP